MSLLYSTDRIEAIRRINTEWPSTIPTTNGEEACCYGMLVAGNQHSDDCTEEKLKQAMQNNSKVRYECEQEVPINFQEYTVKSWMPPADKASFNHWMTTKTTQPVTTRPLLLSERIQAGDILVAQGADGWTLHILDRFHSLDDKRWSAEWRQEENGTMRVVIPASYIDNPEWKFRIVGRIVEIKETPHNTICKRCYGPAYQGIGAIQCEREGGCLAEREPIIVPRLGYPEGGYREDEIYILESAQCLNREAADNGYVEKAWALRVSPKIKWYATLEAAKAAWRIAVIEEAKRKAGIQP